MGISSATGVTNTVDETVGTLVGDAVLVDEAISLTLLGVG